ncbi:MAG: hypothetical protein ACO28P_10710 [Ilumatobacteraceae bacterium]
MENTEPVRRHRKKVAAVAAVTAFVLGIGTAWAISATLTVNSSEAGGSASISGCDTAWTIELDAPTYDSLEGEYVVSGLTYSDVDEACVGNTLLATVIDNSDVSQADGSSVISGATGSITLSTPVPVSAIYGIASAIYGAAVV